MKFDIRRLRQLAEQDFERAWQEGGKLVEREGRRFEPAAKGKTHPLYDLIQRVRGVLLKLGFTEIPVPMIVDKREVYRQYGAEAPVILDRVFFLATLERPDIGISKRKLEEIRRAVPGFDRVEELQAVFRRYKLGQIAADDLVEVISRELGIDEQRAGRILSLFEELRELRPVPTNLTMRSHLTSGWFEVLQAMRFRESLPIQLFSVGPKFRREQRLDESHLYESWTASLVVMAEELTLEDGRELTRRVFRELGHEPELRLKAATSRYYAPGTEFEVFLKHPRTGEPLEVGDGGLYSPVALANYGIPYPVFNLGIGLERLLMVETGETDVRALVYPYRYRPLELSDEQLAELVRLREEPVTEVGRAIQEAIVRTAREHADAPSPCEFTAFEGELEGRRVVVRVVEPEAGTRLIGPAGFNEVRVYDGNVVAVPPSGWEEDEFLKAVRERGVSTRITFIEAFAARAAAEIERAARAGERSVRVRVRNVKQPSDINLELDEVAQRFITSRRKRIDVRGPVFTTVVAELG
jgi:O-phosphoseryl-tRNA synthetase